MFSKATGAAVRRTAVMMNCPDRLKLIPKLLITIGKISLGIRYIVASRHELDTSVTFYLDGDHVPIEDHEEEDEKYSEAKADTIVGIC